MDLEYMKKTIDNSEALFTDIFDTIIYRKNYPDYNKKLWCEAIKNYYNISMNLNDIISLREETEIALREKNHENGYDYEFNYHELIRTLYNKLKIKCKEEDFEKVAEKIEIDIEYRSQEIFSDSLEILKYCKSNNKPVYAISDMYLTKNMLLELLDRHNIKEYFKNIYVSSEFLYSKASKKLFEVVKNKNKNINFINCIMMGDNFYNDNLNATASGYKGIFIDRGIVFNKYKEIKSIIEEKKYISKLNILKEFYKEFDYELYIFETLKEINMQFYKYNIDLITYDEESKDLIDKLKIVNGEQYYSKNIKFEQTDSKAMIKFENDNYVVNIDNIKYRIKKETSKNECFIEIVRYLCNKIYNIKELKFNKIQRKEENNIIPIEELKDVGKKYTPLFEDFIKWMHESIKKNEIEEVYFFTREGEFYKQIFDKIKDKKIKTHVLEVSRIATFFPSFKNIDIKEMKRLWSQYSVQNLKSMFKSLNIDINKYLDIIYKNNLNITDALIEPIKNIKLNNLFNNKDFIELMEEDLKIAKENILGYFKEHNLENKTGKIAIVDIGWRGTIHDNICYILPNKKIYGYYFGLESFLNKQPKNSKKYGYINQYYGKEKILGDITPFEMLSNSANGSTIGYKKENNKFVAIRKIDKVENESYYKCTKFIQDSIIENTGKIKYDKDAPFNAVVEMIYNPHPYIAKSYFNLKHNEEFGLGEFVSKKIKISKMNILKGMFSYENAEKVKHQLENTSWPYGYLVNSNLYKYKDKLPLKKVDEFDKIKVKKKIAWIMPDLLEGSGGHRTIIQNANYLVKKGYQCDLYFNEDYVTTSKEMRERIVKYFGECLCQIYIGFRLRVDYDMIFATYSVLTPEIVNNSECKHKMYFVQDFEPWFTSMGDGYIQMENSYKLGFRAICIGNWLKQKLHKEYKTKISAFPFCADLKIYHPIKVKKEDAICFIFQPDKPRRCVELGLRALKLVKAIKPNIKIYLYGSKMGYYVDFEHENLNIIDLKKCNELYNKCKVGLCISSSNPSRIPFEMMAAGLPVVDLYRENNLYDMPEEGVTLADSTPQSIASAILNLLENEELAKQKSKFGIEYMKKFDIEKGFEIFGNTIDKIFEGDDQIDTNVEKLYRTNPIEVRDDVKSFEFILKYKPACNETTDYLRGLVKKKREIQSKYKFNGLVNKVINKISNMAKR